MKKRFIYTVAALFFLGTTGCEKLEDFGSTNDSPDGVTTPQPQALLTNAQLSVAGFASNNVIALNGALYSQYFSETQYTSASLYALPQISFTGNYSGVLYDLQNIININPTKNMSNVAKILQQYIFWAMTDAWGDIPYTEALKGLDNVTPKYDTQETIYKGILSTLAATNAAFDSSPISGDIIYGGDVASWKRMANSLRVLAAIQLSKKYPSASGYAATEFKAALADAGGVITTNAQNFAIKYPGGNFKSNWWNLYDGRKDYAESKTLTDLTTSYGDARQAAFGGASEVPGTTTSSSTGVPYGVKRETAEAFTAANPNWARVLRGDLRTEDGVVYIITAAEVALARAEAADYGWTTDNMITQYNNGITLSHAQWGVAAPSATYLASSNVALTSAAGTGANLRKISIQRYLASYPDGHQGWNIWRKSGFPVLTPAPDATNSSKQIVQRFTYATSEYSTNAENVKAAAARLPGGDTQDSKVWWNQ